MIEELNWNNAIEKLDVIKSSYNGKAFFHMSSLTYNHLTGKMKRLSALARKINKKKGNRQKCN